MDNQFTFRIWKNKKPLVLPLCKVQKQYGKLYGALYPRGSIEANRMGQDI